MPPEDDQLTVQWLRKAAKQGHAFSMYRMAKRYAEDRAVPKNYVYAYMWMDIAPDDDRFEGARERALKEFEEEMTPSQVKKAKELARACERKQYKSCEV